MRPAPSYVRTVLFLIMAVITRRTKATRDRVTYSTPRHPSPQSVGTRRVIAQHVGHQVCHLRTDDALTGGGGLVDRLSLRIEHSIDGVRGYMHSAIGKGAIGRGNVEQVNA